MNDEEIQLIRRICREVFWEFMETEFLPVLRDCDAMRSDASKSRVKEHKQSTPESNEPTPSLDKVKN
jgi:hypothetical protein